MSGCQPKRCYGKPNLLHMRNAFILFVDEQLLTRSALTQRVNVILTITLVLSMVHNLCSILDSSVSLINLCSTPSYMFYIGLGDLLL